MFKNIVTTPITIIRGIFIFGFLPLMTPIFFKHTVSPFICSPHTTKSYFLKLRKLVNR